MRHRPTTSDPSPVANDASDFARLSTGDPAALDTLLQRHWSPLLAYIRGLIGDGDDAARDIAQETFVYLWEGRERWRTHSVRALLYRAARSRALNHVRHDRVRARSGPFIQALHRERRRPSTPLEILEQAELRNALEEAVETLPPRRREVFTLGYIHGCRHAEVADIMEISEQTARNHMSAALADLRRMLGPFLD